MLKFRKVYICDCCGKVEAPRYSGKPYFLHRQLPLYWEKIAGKTLCSNCADSYKLYKAMTYAKERIFFRQWCIYSVCQV